jgi:predicted transcriptional regulator
VKTTISVSDDLFQAVERLARRTGKSRNQLFNEAVREYFARHATAEMTQAMDRVCAQLEPGPDKFTAATARRTLERVGW